MIELLEVESGITFTDYQREAVIAAASMAGNQRACLYYKTGAGKSFTSLAMLRVWGHESALVIAPPSTHPEWAVAGARFGVDVECMSHAKFRMKGTKLSRTKAVIADEMHMFGRNTSSGWMKLDSFAAGLQAPLVMASATPNYNDAERVYCIQRVLDRRSTHGGFLEFLYAHCTTEQNPHSMTPLVTGFQRFADASEYLAQLPGVFYLPDDLVYQIEDVPFHTDLPDAYDTYGYNIRKHRIVASQMEDRHTRAYQQLVAENGQLRAHVLAEVKRFIDDAGLGQVLIFANHATVATAAYENLMDRGFDVDIVTGDSSTKAKAETLKKFKQESTHILVGTSTLATGTDGLDKVCNHMLILDDTDDDSLRRQLIGRIMPRGLDNDATGKRVVRLVHHE